MNKFKFFILFFVAIIFFTGCGNFDSPEDAFAEMQSALNKRDREKLSSRIDLEKFFAETYDEETEELAKNYDVYAKKYPDDPYFQHDAEFLKQYNLEQRERHLKFLNEAAAAYFENLPEPDKPEGNPHAYVAKEFEGILNHSSAVVKEIKKDGNHAVMTVEMQGDNSIHGKFIGKLTFKIGFEKDEKDRWKFTKVENLDELTPTLVDKAELIWVTFF